MHVRTTMTREVLCVSPDDNLPDAYELMRENQIRHLAVLDDTQLVGVLSEKDVYLYSDVDGERMQVRDVSVADAMTANVLSCRPGTTIADAAALMIERQISCLPVTTADGALVGLITTTDLLDLLRMREENVANDEIPFTYRVRPADFQGQAEKARRVYTI